MYKLEFRARKTKGFTLVELLVVIAIIAMLVTAILPAIQAARSSARRAQCKSNMMQLVMAMQNYEMAQGHFAAGVTDTAGPIRSEEVGLHHGWLIAMLPYVDEGSLYRNVDLKASVYDEANSDVRKLAVPLLNCPSDTSALVHPKSSYAACHHDVEAPIDDNNHGVFFLNSQLAVEDVRDGLSHTIFLGEKISDDQDLGWMSGTRSTLRNTGTPINVDPWKPAVEGYVDRELGEDVGYERRPLTESKDNSEATPAKTPLSVGGFGSYHGGGAFMAFGDGRIQFMSSAVSSGIYQQLGHRDDGKLLDPSEYRE